MHFDNVARCKPKGCTSVLNVALHDRWNVAYCNLRSHTSKRIHNVRNRRQWLEATVP